MSSAGDKGTKLKALCRLLNECGKSALQTRISCQIENDSTYAAEMQAEKVNFSQTLPLPLLKKLYGEPEEKPTPLHRLSLRSTIILCFLLPRLKDRFQSEEKDALTKLNEILLNVYNATVRLKSADELTDGLIDQLVDNAASSLGKLGLDETNLKQKFAEFVSEYDRSDDGQENELIADLHGDELIVTTHLKLIAAEIHEKRAYKETIPQWLAECESEIAKIRKESQLSLDGFSNVRKSIQKTLESYLKCGFCGEETTDPRTFPCLHSFCLACVKSRTLDKVCSCPTCCTRVAVGDGTKIDELPLSFVADACQKLLDACRRKVDDVADVECKICVRTPTLFCLTCRDTFCDNHGVPFFHETHAVATLAQFCRESAVVALACKYCPQHKKELNAFCPSCAVPLCSAPICVSWHGQHSGGVEKLVPLKDAVEEYRRRADEFNDLLKKKTDRIESKIDSIERNQIDVANLQENIRESIIRFFDDIDCELKRVKEMHLHDLDRVADQCMQANEQTRQVLQQWKTNARRLGAKLQDLATDDHRQLASVTELSGVKNPLLADTCTGATITDSKGISYPESNLRCLLQQASSLKSSQISPMVQTRGWEPLFKMQGMKNFLVHSKNLYVVKRNMLAGHQLMLYDLHTVDKDPHVFCESATHAFQAVAMNCLGEVCVPEEVQHTLELPSFRQKRYVNVSVYNANREKARDVQATHLSTFSKVLFKSAGKYLYMADDSCVCEMKPNGELVRKFNFVNMLSVGDFATDPLRDVLFITDTEKHCLMIFDCKRQNVITVGDQTAQPGVTPESFSFPTGVAIDPYGHVFVADSGNGRIQAFECSGKFTKLIPFPPSVKETVPSSGSSSYYRTVIQAYDDYLYLMDMNSDTMWRLRYL